MNDKLKNDFLLLLTAFIWGSAFIAQSAGADLVGPFTFNTFRYALGVVALTPVIMWMDKKRKASGEVAVKPAEHPEDEGFFKTGERRTLIVGGIITGIILFASSGIQQYAIAYTTAAKSGFITTLYVIIVPFMGLFLKKKVRPIVWLCAVLGIFGLYLLAIEPGTFSFGKGEFYTFICAIGFSCHIMVIDFLSPKVDGVRFSRLQFLTTSVLSCIVMILNETVVLSDLKEAWFSLIYAGIFSSAIAYTLQIVAQKNAEPAVASLILSLESVFAAICGVFFLHEYLNGRELMGCILVFAATIIAQVPAKGTFKLGSKIVNLLPFCSSQKDGAID